MDSTTLKLTQALVARRSITPGDAECQKLVQDRLGKFGFVCSTLQSGEMTNLWARRSAGRPVVRFAGHTDVVPAGPLSGRDTYPFNRCIYGGMLDRLLSAGPSPISP
jgi:succinyl-diaminopimelate desuccinylase